MVVLTVLVRLPGHKMTMDMLRHDGRPLSVLNKVRFGQHTWDERQRELDLARNEDTYQDTALASPWPGRHPEQGKVCPG